MKKIMLSVFVLTLLVGILPAQSIDEIVTKNLNAMGGVAKLHKVKSLVMENTIKIQGMEIENLTTILLGKAVRSNSKIMGDYVVQAFDGTTAWAITPIAMGGNGEPQEMSEQMAKDVINQVDPFPLLDYVKKGTRLKLLANEKVKDKDAYHLKISPKNGVDYEIWIDVANGLMSKLKTMQNGQEVEVVFTNYREVEGLNFAISMETTNPAAGIILIDTRTVKLNSAIDESIFKMPNKN